MIFVHRNGAGKITATSPNLQEGWSGEQLPDTDVEVVTYLTPGGNAVIDAKIAALEVKELLPRVTREYFLSDFVAKAATQGYTEPQLYAASAAYKRLKDFDGQIAALRAGRV
jgi:hypothetical protein